MSSPGAFGERDAVALGVVPIGCTRSASSPTCRRSGEPKAPTCRDHRAYARSRRRERRGEPLGRCDGADRRRARGALDVAAIGPRRRRRGARAGRRGSTSPVPMAVRARRLGRVDGDGAHPALVRRVRCGVAAAVDVAGERHVRLRRSSTSSASATCSPTRLDRYPEVSLEEVAARAPNLIVLPSEPYEFGPEHAREIEREVDGVPIAFVDGRDLFWWGSPHPAAAARLAAMLQAEPAAECSPAEAPGTVRPRREWPRLVHRRADRQPGRADQGIRQRCGVASGGSGLGARRPISPL